MSSPSRLNDLEEIAIRVEPDPYSLVDNLTQIYSAAFRPPPYNKTVAESQSFAIGFDRMVMRQDYRLVVAWDQDLPIGFAYGHKLLPAYGWHKVLGQPLRDAGHGSWLDDAFCLTEMAVVPAYWGEGIGGRLHDKLFEGLTYQRYLLSTMQDDSTNGYQMYLKRGWFNLIENYWVSAVDRSYRVMGRWGTR